MPDKDVVLAKVATIQKCLARINETTALDPASIDDINSQDIFVLNLQRAIQAAIDMASHVVASEKLGLPETIKRNFALLRDGGIISQPVARKMEKMTGFRNIAVHDYKALDPEILKSILTNNLADLEEFYSAILAFCDQR